MDFKDLSEKGHLSEFYRYADEIIALGELTQITSWKAISLEAKMSSHFLELQRCGNKRQRFWTLVSVAIAVLALLVALARILSERRTFHAF